MKKISLYILATLFGLFGFTSCIDDDYSEPNVETPSFTLPEGAQLKTIAQLKDLYRAEFPNTSNPLDEDEFYTIEEDYYIAGYVVSNDQYGNFYKNLVIQEDLSGSAAGINISIGESDLNAKFAIGQKVFVKCQNLVLGLYGNNIQLGGGYYHYIKRGKDEYRLSSITSPSIPEVFFNDGEIQPVAPKVISINEALAANSDELHRFTYVKFENVQFKESDAGTTWGNIEGDHSEAFPFKSTTIEDQNGTELTVFTSNYSDFAALLTPEGSGTISGVLSAHNGEPQLVVNTLEDVAMNGSRFTAGQTQFTIVDNFTNNFSDQAENQGIRGDGWYNLEASGSRDWIAKVFNNDTYAQASGYNSGDSENISVLITPAVNVSTQKVLSFQTAKAYWAHNDGNHPLEVLYSSDFDGTNYSTATWQTINATVAQKTDADHAWINSGNIDLPIIDGAHISIAFRYTGSETESSTIRLDNVSVN